MHLSNYLTWWQNVRNQLNYKEIKMSKINSLIKKIAWFEKIAQSYSKISKEDQKRLSDFVVEKNLQPALKIDGKLGEKTRKAINMAKAYLGHGGGVGDQDYWMDKELFDWLKSPTVGYKDVEKFTYMPWAAQADETPSKLIPPVFDSILRVLSSFYGSLPEKAQQNRVFKDKFDSVVKRFMQYTSRSVNGDASVKQNLNSNWSTILSEAMVALSDLTEANADKTRFKLLFDQWVKLSAVWDEVSSSPAGKELKASKPTPPVR